MEHTLTDQNVAQSPLLSRARDIARQYRIILEPRDEEEGFLASVVEMPGVVAVRATEAQCVEALRDAMTAAVATLLDAGRLPPRAAGMRLSEQVNVRLSMEEKVGAESAARGQGFRGLSDYIRALILRDLKA